VPEPCTIAILAGPERLVEKEARDGPNKTFVIVYARYMSIHEELNSTLGLLVASRGWCNLDVLTGIL
jgi:hypothetical protein